MNKTLQRATVVLALIAIGLALFAVLRSTRIGSNLNTTSALDRIQKERIIRVGGTFAFLPVLTLTRGMVNSKASSSMPCVKSRLI